MAIATPISLGLSLPLTIRHLLGVASRLAIYFHNNSVVRPAISFGVVGGIGEVASDSHDRFG